MAVVKSRKPGPDHQHGGAYQAFPPIDGMVPFQEILFETFFFVKMNVNQLQIIPVEKSGAFLPEINAV